MSDSDARSEHGISGLDPNSYVASRLKHASPEHLHLTSRRFFIGPIPEGWLNSNRKAWYKRRLELSNFSSRQATFTAAEHQGTHHRTVSGLQQPSLAARMQFSFPQPADAFDDRDSSRERESENAEEDTDEEVETRALAPVSTADVPRIVGIVDSDAPTQPKRIPVPLDKGLRGVDDDGPGTSILSRGRAESWVTAQEEPQNTPKDVDPHQVEDGGTQEYANTRPSTSTRGTPRSMLQSHGLDAAADNIDSGSRTALLEADSRPISPKEERHVGGRMTKYSPAPVQSPEVDVGPGQRASGVRFKVTEGVTNQQRRIVKRVDSARYRVANKMSRRVLKEGTIVKMERMLVRMDVTLQKLPDDFDENESVKTETKAIEKWTEFMAVARRNSKQDEDDFRLQFYKTRVIPEIENESTKKKPAREIRLLPKTTHVNLYSSLDKTVVIWHSYRKGTRIIILRPASSSHSVEWYTFLRDALGWHRPGILQVTVPDLGVQLHLDKPFQGLEAAGLEAEDEAAAINRTVEAERAVASVIVQQSMEMLDKDPEWAEVLKKWSETSKMGLAWKRYDRLEWIHGVNERKMFGSMAMQHSYDLELRPKHHYPTSAHGKKGKLHEEPAPVEGFLVRLTSQKGVHRRYGKAFFKRLYFATQDQYLVFNRPAKITPPHPPRLASISGSNIPSSREIVQSIPMMYEVEPFRLENNSIKWLRSGHDHTIRQHDVEALDEAQRNVTNLMASDGYINMTHIIKVRKIKWGASDADEGLDSGSDVDFHAEVENTTREDGTTTQIDDDRIFELVLENQLVIRLQAYNKDTRDEWMKRLKKLVKYWKLRATADITNLKAVRQSNLNQLNIDEEMEARIGQFARKWEVSRSDASPDLYNMCRLTACRTITMSGMVYRKTRRHSTFQRCSVFLSGGQMLIYQAALRKSTGEQIPHIHQEKQQVVDLRDCYVYSGLLVEEDLLYQNRTFDANHAGMLAATPRIYLDDGWTSADVDVMTCFVVWMNKRKGWFRSATSDGGDTSTHAGGQPKGGSSGGTRSRLKRVAQLGVPGRGMVFKCRSRAERDLWVLGVAAEIEAAVEKEHGHGNADRDTTDVRLEH